MGHTIRRCHGHGKGHTKHTRSGSGARLSSVRTRRHLREARRGRGSFGDSQVGKKICAPRAVSCLQTRGGNDEKKRLLVAVHSQSLPSRPDEARGGKQLEKLVQHGTAKHSSALFVVRHTGTETATRFAPLIAVALSSVVFRMWWPSPHQGSGEDPSLARERRQATRS